MSLKIYHGAPGSYKTSGAVWNDFVPAVFEGRHIVTNVRGLSDPDKVISVLSSVKEFKKKEIPDSFKLIYIDTTESENLEKIRRWFHWIPDGALLLLDEIQMIYPKSITATQFKQFDYEGGLDAATAAGRFPTLALALEQHRHKNWDIVVTTPSIKLVHPVVRAVAETAFKHINNAIKTKLLKGTYNEAFHLASQPGSKADIYVVRKRRIPKWVFQLYQSTATGQVTDTQAGGSVLSDPRLAMMIGVIALAVTFVFYNGIPSLFTGSTHATNANLESNQQALAATPQTHSPAPHTAFSGTGQTTNPNSPHVVNVPRPTLQPDPFWLADLKKADTVYLNSLYYHGKKPFYLIRVESKKGAYTYDQKELFDLGINVKIVNKCLFKLKYQDFEMIVTCPPLQIEPEEKTNPVLLTTQNPFGG